MIQRIIAFIILLFLLPLLFILSVVYKLTAWREPFLFLQERTGKDNKPFTIYKIRTMRVGAESLQAKYRYLNERDGPVFKIQNDPRFIPIGKVLSRTGLDEIPQLWNIVKGEMAFVGPRPLPMYETKKIEGIYSKRFSVLPGLTSLWVVRGAHQLNFREWMELDIWYVDHRSIQMDLKILLLTVLVLSQFILKQISMIIFDNK